MDSLITLTPLSPREAVADALHRCVLGIDSNDLDMFKSACLQNESMKVTAGSISIEGWSTINEYFARLFALVTTHLISNIRIQLKDSENTASLTAHAIAYHIRPDDALKLEDTSYTAACLYFIDLVKDTNDSLWKIKTWDIKVLWTTGDRAVVHG